LKFVKTAALKKHTIGKKLKSIEIIAEIANAHQGDHEVAIKLGLAAFNAKANAIKFQVYFVDEMLTKNHPRYKHFLQQSFSPGNWEKIFKKFKNYKVYADVFGLNAYNLVEKFNISGIKIHASDFDNKPLLQKIKNKKVFLSCGGASFFEIAEAIKILKKKNSIVLIHGFQSYPTDVADINFKRFKFLINEFSEYTEFGYQDHTSGSNNLNFYLPFVSIGLGATYLEKHITFNRNKKGTDYYSSIEPNKFFKFVKSVRSIEKAFSLKENDISSSEKQYNKIVKKVWVAKKDIKKEQILSLSNIEIKRIESGTYNANLKNVIGRRTNKEIKKTTQIFHSNVKQKIFAVILVRSDSKRLKKKWKLKINNECILGHLINRVKLSKRIDDIIVCTTKNKSDNDLVKFLKNYKVKIFRGSNLNVLSRIIEATDNSKFDHIVRITGDDILIDPKYMDLAIDYHLENNADYTDHKSLPSGMETEIFRREVLKKILISCIEPNDTEYLTNYIQDNKDHFNIKSAPLNIKFFPKISLTIDYKEDFLRVKNFLEFMKKKDKNYNYTLKDVVSFFKTRIKTKKKLLLNNHISNTKISWKKLINY